MAGEAKERCNCGVFACGCHRLDVPDSPIQEKEQEQTLKRSIEHLHGPEEVNYEIDELVALVLMRNGKSYIETFVEHYFSLEKSRVKRAQKEKSAPSPVEDESVLSEVLLV